MGTDPRRGLTAGEVQARVASGLTNRVDSRTSRTVGEIVRANVFTRFNAILGALLAVILVVGPLRDALFGIVLVSNTLIGIVQEVRAKRALDRLALLTATTATVVRDGATARIGSGDVVQGDVVVAGPGDQIVADGPVVGDEAADVDESLLTGESDPVAKRAGDDVLSGSFVVTGSVRYEATAVGEAAYARTIAAEARRFELVRSELRHGIDTILRGVTWVMVPAATLLVASQLVAHDSLQDAIRSSVGGVGSMVPEGLVLLTSLAFAVGTIRLGRRNVLVQELAALEGLARVDVVLTDKTGTLTEPDLDVADIEPVNEHVDLRRVERALSLVAAADPAPNATLRGVARRWPAADAPPTAHIPFSSERKWSAVADGDGCAWVLGAPDVLLPDGDLVRARAGERSAAGQRVLLLATAAHLDVDLGQVAPLALIALEERVRPDAAEVLAFFADEGVAVKLVSGDHPATVGAVAARLGLGDGEGVDGRALPDDPTELARALEANAAVGRVTPQQKREIVHALRGAGHTVAMVGDGVNDVLALKAADIGVAMGSGTAASRAVARAVLVDNRFASLPHVVAEGRRVIGNVERVANLFVTKTVYAVVLALSVGVARVPFPFLPRQLTIVSSLTIGIPAFFLALAPNTQRARPGFVGRVLSFAVPAGLVAATATMASYGIARSAEGVSLAEARTTATVTLFAVALWVLALLARPLDDLRLALVGAMVAAFAVALLTPPIREFFALDPPPLVIGLAGVGILSMADALLEAGWRTAGRVARVRDRRRSARAASP